MKALMDKIKVDVYAGSRIDKAISEAKTLAMVTHMEVEFTFNGVKVLVDRFESEGDILAKFWTQMKAANDETN